MDSLKGLRVGLTGNREALSTARRKLWCDVWVALAGTTYPTTILRITKWADAAVKDFDERFGPIEGVTKKEEK